MTEDEWIEQYNPLPAPTPGNGFDFGNGCTLIAIINAAEEKYLENTDEKHIWTVVDDGESTAIISGKAFVNRLGYIVTEKPWADEFVEIVLEE